MVCYLLQLSSQMKNKDYWICPNCNNKYNISVEECPNCNVSKNLLNINKVEKAVIVKGTDLEYR